MSKTWQSNRYEWTTKTKAEEVFEKQLEEAGFTVKGIKEWGLKTDYKIVKDGREIDYSLWVSGKDGKDESDKNIRSVLEIFDGMKAVNGK